MEYLYSAYTKLVDDNIYYFVKKMITFPEFKGISDVLAGYGMHTDFEKACSICGIDDSACRRQLSAEMEQRKLAEIPIWLPIVQTKAPRNVREKQPVQITGMLARWPVERGAALFN